MSPHDDIQDDIQDAIPPEYVAAPDAPHGTRNCYQNYMCRCDLCRAAHNRYMKQYRATRAARRTRRPATPHGQAA